MRYLFQCHMILQKSHYTFRSIDFHSNACECVRPETQARGKNSPFAAFQRSSLVNSDLRIRITWRRATSRRSIRHGMTSELKEWYFCSRFYIFTFWMYYFKLCVEWRHITTVTASEEISHVQSLVWPRLNMMIWYSLIINPIYSR